MSLAPHHLLAILEPWLQAPRWWVGLSGGLDSTVLLHLLAELRATRPLPPLHAIHVDHQLNPSAAAWAEHCRGLCTELGIELSCRQVVTTADGRGPEAAARAARYAVFEDLVGSGELLLLAHHRDDQVETFFLRLLRGAGTLGLGGMPARRQLGRGELARPLLAWQRAELESWARERELQWVEDESNRDQSLDRNYLRHAVLPQLEARWPGYRESIEQGMRWALEAEQELNSDYGQILAGVSATSYGESVLDLEPLQPLDEHSLCRLLRVWLSREGVAPPGRDRLQEFARQLCRASDQARPRLDLEQHSIERYRQCLHLRRAPGDITAGAGSELRPAGVLSVPPLGELQACEAAGGLRSPRTGAWRVGFRQGGERCRPAGRAHSQSLKKLLQEHGVPPWWRDRLPLLYDGDELAAVADLWICEGFRAAPGEPGYQLRWR